MSLGWNETVLETAEWLRNYPIEKKWSDGAPDWLKEEDYPGRDFVIGMCEEQIENFTKIAMTHKNEYKRKLAKGYADIFIKVLEDREKKLSQYGKK